MITCPTLGAERLLIKIATISVPSSAAPKRIAIPTPVPRITEPIMLQEISHPS